MSRIRVLFIPWSSSFAGEQLDKCKKWVDQYNKMDKEGKKTTLAVYRGRKLQIVNSRVSMYDSIYVRGHGSSGGSSISIKLAHDKTDSLSYTEVCDRLIESGLNKYFKGKIKFWNCHSGEDAGPALAFAKRCADYLRGKDYTKCTYYGYKYSIHSYYNTRAGGTHRYAAEKVGGIYQVRGRASEQRVKV